MSKKTLVLGDMSRKRWKKKTNERGSKNNKNISTKRILVEYVPICPNMSRRIRDIFDSVLMVVFLPLAFIIYIYIGIL